MNTFLKNLTNLPIYALLSSIFGMMSGFTAVATAIKYLLEGSEEGSVSIPRKLTWGELMTISPTLMMGGMLVLVGSFLVLRRKYKLGAVLVLVPGIFYSMFAGLPYLIALFTNHGYGISVEVITLAWLVGIALPIASGALALSVKRELPSIEEYLLFRKRIYSQASFILGLMSGISALIVGPFLIGSFPWGIIAPFLIVDGALMIYGSYCVLKKKFVKGALFILVPGFLFGFCGFPMLIETLVRLLSGRFLLFGSLGYLEFFLGLAVPVASAILAIYSRE